MPDSGRVTGEAAALEATATVEVSRYSTNRSRTKVPAPTTTTAPSRNHHQRRRHRATMAPVWPVQTGRPPWRRSAAPCRALVASSERRESAPKRRRIKGHLRYHAAMLHELPELAERGYVVLDRCDLDVPEAEYL